MLNPIYYLFAWRVRVYKSDGCVVLLGHLATPIAHFGSCDHRFGLNCFCAEVQFCNATQITGHYGIGCVGRRLRLWLLLADNRGYTQNVAASAPVSSRWRVVLLTQMQIKSCHMVAILPQSKAVVRIHVGKCQRTQSASACKLRLQTDHGPA